MRKGIVDARASGLAIGGTASGYERGSLRRVVVLVGAVEEGIAVWVWSGDEDSSLRGCCDTLESARGSTDGAQSHLHCWIDWFDGSLQSIDGSIATLTSSSKAKISIEFPPSLQECKYYVILLPEKQP
jgi:hypothetical protein